MKKLVPLIVILLFCLSARADYHYASHEGSNEYPYTSWETAADIIQDAVDAAEGGDTIYVGAGDYHQRVFLHADSLALMGMGMDSTRIWYDVPYYEVIVVDSAATISDMLIEHTADFVNVIWGGFYRRYKVERCRFEGGGVYFSNVGGTVRNCIFNGPHSWVGNSIGNAYLEVSNCRFYTTEITPISSHADTNIITNNIIRVDGTNIGAGIKLTVGQVYDYVANNLVVIRGATDGIHMGPRNEGLVLVNNTIDTLYRWQFEAWHGVYIFRDSVSISIANNAITGGERAGIGFSGINKTLYASYNNLWGNSQDFSVDPSSEIDTTFGILHDYPMFIGDGDYHLQAFSPLIDAGDPDILDVDGTRSDIGCYGGPGGCAYIYLDLAPLIPDSITVEVEEDLVTLTWRFNTEADFNRYQVFRDTISGFTPSEFNMIAEPDTSYYEDEDIDPGTAYYYRLTSIDNQGNISDFSDEVGFIPTDISPFSADGLPRYTVIESAYPNPFNSNVTIVYSASNLGPQPPAIKLQVFDIRGRVVRTLVDDRMPMGTYRAIWDGTNDSGEPVSSGTYIARVSQWGTGAVDFPVKITLIR